MAKDVSIEQRRKARVRKAIRERAYHMWNDAGRPENSIVPLSGWTWPERIFSIVDLPEPFSPTRE